LTLHTRTHQTSPSASIDYTQAKERRRCQIGPQRGEYGRRKRKEEEALQGSGKSEIVTCALVGIFVVIEDEPYLLPIHDK
jgi:hypothetical protein